MKIGIVSDIHCNAGGLQIALDLMGDVDELICSGDAIYQYRFSNEVIALLRERGARVILGNHEATFLSPEGERARSAPTIDRAHLAWLGAQPRELTSVVGGKKLLVVHGSPWEPFSEYIYPTSRGMGRFRDIDADIVVMGHTHHQMAVRAGRVMLVNSGSAGEARDHRNGRLLSFAVLDAADGSLALCEYADPRFAANGSMPAPRWYTPEPPPVA